MNNLLLERHRRLVQLLDQRLRTIRSRHAAHLRCAPGCAGCCHGLFDVSLSDAAMVREGLSELPAETRAAVLERALPIQRSLEAAFPELDPPYLLAGISEDRVDQFIDQVGKAPCPFLDGKDSCLIYQYRPLACRLEGIPMVDAKDGLFADWCELNYKGGLTAQLIDDLRLDYYEIEEIEGGPTVFIPSVIVCPAFP